MSHAGMGLPKTPNPLKIGVLLIFAIVLLPVPSPAEAEAAAVEPALLSMFPLGGRRGETVRAEVRGVGLEGAYAGWFDASGLGARVIEVAEVKDPSAEPTKPGQGSAEKKPTVYRALVELKIEPTAGLGAHSFRLVSPRGVSNAIAFRVGDEPTLEEVATPHQSVAQAQPVTFPLLINGRLKEPGELDYYAFDASKGQELSFEIIRAEQFEPRLALYGKKRSWLNPDRPNRLLFQEERAFDLMPVKAQSTFRVPEDGQYFLEVSSVFGKGGPDCPYQLRISSRDSARRPEAESAPREDGWAERSFSRKLPEDWIAMIQGRSVDRADAPTPGAKLAASAPAGGAGGVDPEQKPKSEITLPARPSPVTEREPNDQAAQAQPISIPAVIEGEIERPGDIDSFKFKVEAGQKLVFEVETPDTKPPYFNPRLGVIDSQDHELFANVHRRVSIFNNNAERLPFLGGLEPKATYTFEHSGEYVLQVRDITARYGAPGYRYRILVRPQIPHVGEVSADVDGLNLVRGKPRTLTIKTSYEEGFTGEVLFSFTGLPGGVDAYPAAAFQDDKAPAVITENPEIIAPKAEKSAMVLLARPDAPITKMPSLVQLRCQAVENGKLGSSMLVQEIPLIVVEAGPGGQPQAERVN